MRSNDKKNAPISESLLVLFQKDISWWKSFENPGLAGKNLVDLLYCWYFVQFDEDTNLHIERCIWLSSKKTDFKNFKKKFKNCPAELKSKLDNLSETNFLRKKREWAYTWLRRVLSEPPKTTDPVRSFHLDYLNQLGFTRESMVKDIIREPEQDKRRFHVPCFRKWQISDFFRDENGKVDFAARRHLARLAEWFITRRYDFFTARWLVRERLKLDNIKVFPYSWGWIFLWILLAGLFSRIALSNPYIGKKTFGGFFSFHIIFNSFPSPAILLTVLIYAAFLSKIFDIILYPLKALLLMPRMIASLIIGYLLLLLTKDIWELVFSLSNDLITLIIVIIMILSYSYLFFEISKSISEKGRIEIFWRSFFLLIRGLGFSFAMGFMLMDWFAAFFIKAIKPEMPLKVLHSYFGLIPIKIYFLFAVSAFLLGIVLQAIWEDKPITEPI